jgi:TolB protein
MQRSRTLASLSCMLVATSAVATQNARSPQRLAGTHALVRAGLTSVEAPDSLVEAVVYTTLRPPNWDIYLFDKPGGPPRRLTNDPALDYNAVFSPDGRWVVFTSERTGNVDLYALNLKNGGAPVRLTRDDAMDDAASFSPDGQRLAFMSTRDGDADIFVMPFSPGDPTAESRARNLTRRPGGDFNPAFSPDGRRIAFSRQDQLLGSAQKSPIGSFSTEQYGVQLYIMNADGSNPRRLSNAGTTFETFGFKFPAVSGSPAWSRDGGAIYYYSVGLDGAEIRRLMADGSDDSRVASNGLAPAVRRDGRIGFVRPPTPRVLVDDIPRSGTVVSVAADGSDLREESKALSSCFAPDYDHGSDRMLCHGPGALSGYIVSGEGRAFAPPDATRQVRLPDRAVEVRGIRGYFPALTPAGDVLSTPHIESSDGLPVPLQTSGIDGSGMRELFRPPSGIAWGAAVARDAGAVVFTVGTPFAAIRAPDAAVNLWKMRLDGSEPVNLTPASTANNALPHISADGRRIVFRSGRSATWSVFVMDGDGKNPRRLTDSAARETMPALSPDGEWVVFTTERVDVRKLWLQRVDGSEGRLLEPERRDTPDISMHPRFSPDGKWVVFTSNRAGFNDEWPLTWFPQGYGELWAVPLSGGPAVRLTHNKWEDGPSDWGYVRLPRRQP